MSLTNAQEGLKVYQGSEYNIRIAPSNGIKEEIDFTLEGSSRLVFPSSFTIKEEKEIIEQALIGLPTALKFLGKTQIMGDIGDIATTNGIAYTTALTLGGVVKSENNDKALISITYTKGEFVIDITKTATTTTQVDFVLSPTVTKSITINSGMTVREFIEAVNNIEDENNNKLFLALLHIGEGTETLNFFDGKENTTTCIPSNVCEFFTVGDLADEYKKTLAPYIHFIIPKRGNANYFNLLVSSVRAPMSKQYTGCRFLSLNMTYANSALTTVTSNVWGGKADDYYKTPTQAEVDDISQAYSQTNGQTSIYICGERGLAIGSMTNNFAWAVEPSWNVANEPYEVPQVKYTDSFDFEAMFNKQSNYIFQKRVNESKNIDVLLETNTIKNDLNYKLIKSAKTLLGQPQYPEIAEGVISLNASGFTSIASTGDPFTTMMIMTSDSLLDVNYTKEQVKLDFPNWVSRGEDEEHKHHEHI